MSNLLIEIVRAVVQLVQMALNGDRKAYKKVRELLPEHLKSELAKLAAEEAARRKFAQN